MATVHPPPPQHCRSCGAPVYWAESESTGKRMPVDAATNERGNVRLVLRHRQVVAQVLPKAEADALTGAAVLSDQPLPLRLNHYVSCPHAQAWRAKARSRRAAGRGEEAQRA